MPCCGKLTLAVQLECKPAPSRGMNHNKKRTKENLHPSDEGSNILTKDEEKAEVLNIFFASVFSSRVDCSPSTQTPELVDRGGEQNVIQREVVKDLLHHLDIHKPMGPDGIQPRVLRELAEMLSKPLSIIYQQSWQTGEVPVDWRIANAMPIHKKGWKNDLGNYRPVSLTSVPGKVMEQLNLSAIMQHMKDNQTMRPSQHGFMKPRSCLTNLISFYDKATPLVDEGWMWLWMFSTWTLVKPLTPFPTAFSWRNCLLTAGWEYSSPG
ncbi:rna-directed dna polymerase from mobile element jockey-like [Limosa lapponica baueri]|uniref:Rna-directed dna polymerase from mobile element jockey-like n=1 Tax=Limosa lapponica baueri TaxID=1758121 RepID=A0A2I0U6E8_LIMLA|nr:rna-directed dna polymerase from mobile element jockey-like [Limosa lapponica baueri]